MKTNGYSGTSSDWGIAEEPGFSGAVAQGLPAPTSAIAREVFQTSPDAQSGEWAFPAPLAMPRPLVPSSRAVARSIALPRPKVAARPRPRYLDREFVIQRLLEILPGASALFLISTFIWGWLFLPVPFVIGLIAFDLYWAWRSINTGIHIVRGHAILKRHAKVDWRQRYNEAAAQGKAYVRWEDVLHAVIIPSYKESVEKLSTTLETLASQTVGGEHLAIILALEGAEKEAPEKAKALQEKFGDRFAVFLPTFHPPDLSGEIKGKSSNENWAARIAKRTLVDEMGHDLDHITVTSCDADTQFPPNYYSCLSYKFATNAKRYRRFWQAPIFYYNNVWEVPAPLRMPNSLGGLSHLAKLTRKYVVRFPQSTYSLSLRMAHEVDYWDPEIISEDWHMFLKCFFHCGGTVDVEPIFLPVGNDGVRADGYFRTFFEHYQQARRHAWGATDIPYAIKKCFAHPEIRLRTRVRRTWSIFENHVLWSSQWFLISVPAATVFLFNTHIGPEWFGDWSKWILKPCMAPLLVMIAYDMLMRPSRPKTFSRWLYPVQFVQWMLMAVITFLFNALPALDAQIRLMLGKRLEYKVTPKA